MHTPPLLFAPVTALHAAGLTCLFLVLALRVVMLRKWLETGLGDAGDPRLQRAIRAHGNLAENAPMALLLLLLMELNGAEAALLHVGGGLLFISRAVHAYGVSQMRERTGWRTAGMVGTFTVLSGAAAWLLGVGLAVK